MKKLMKLSGVFILTVIAAVSAVTCENDTNSNNQGNKEPEPITDFTIFNGLWWNADMVDNDANGSMGVWMFHYPYFWSLNCWGYAWKGQYMIEGEIDAEGEASGEFGIAVTNKKDINTGYHWRENTELPESPRQFRFKELGDDAVLIINNVIFERTTWESHEANNSMDNTWQVKIGDSGLNDLIVELTPPLAGRPVENTAINGLWWKEDLINSSSADPGVWVFNYPNFWRLNSSGAAQRGTYTVAGAFTNENGASAGSFTASITGNKSAGGAWTSASSSAVINWTLNENGMSMTINPGAEFLKIKWNSPHNKPENKGPWQDKIGDPALNEIIPPVYGWDSAGLAFALPPFFDPQPAPSRDVINTNTASYTRDLQMKFTAASPNPPAMLSTSGDKTVSIRSHGVDGSDHNNNLTAALLRTAGYLILKLDNNFDGVFNSRTFIIGLYAPALVPYSDTLWANSTSRMTEPYYIRQAGVWNAARGCGYDNVNKLVAIELPKALPLSDTPMFQNAAVTSNMKIIIGLESSSSSSFFTDMPITGIYLVHLTD